MIGGLIALVVVLAAASAAGLALRARQGRFRPDSSRATGPERPEASGAVLTAADLGAPLGDRVTLVQFSTKVCAYCGPTRKLLSELARERDGVAFIEVDAAERMDLSRRLHVLSTPTVLVLDAAGGISSRASGPPRQAELLIAVGRAVGPGGETS
ncbi:MAG TPA: thioredoxin family protein [Trebonia sp.]